MQLTQEPHPRPSLRPIDRLSTIPLACLLSACPASETPLPATTTDSSDTTATSSSSSAGPTTDDPPPTPTTGSLAATSTGETSDTSHDDTSGGPTPTCGNGLIDPGEMCDLGSPHNWDQGACTSQCHNAVCGDGLIFVGVETCDNAQNNTADYGQCDPITCLPGPHCGDNHLDPEEECDGGSPDGGGPIDGADVPCRPGCAWDGRLAFVSSTKYDGNLGGLTGADLKCRLLAEAQHFHAANRFKAWLSDAEATPLTRFSFGPNPLVLPNGLLVAADLAALIDDGPGDGIRVTETGETLLKAYIWTNTAFTGDRFSASDHCAAWTSASKQAKARSGVTAWPKQPVEDWNTWHDQRHWTSYQTNTCNRVAHLYCIED